MKHAWKRSARSIRMTAMAVAGLFAIGIAIPPAAQAQTYTVLHTFTGVDGANPEAGLVMDRAGNLYGTTTYGGTHFKGNVFKMTRRNSSWIFSNLYSFAGGTDGENPEGNLVIAPDGSLYGTTNQGGNQQCGYGNGCGTIFRLQPPARACASAQCPWTETVLYRFDGSNGAGFPIGDIALDQSGNVYGMAAYIYELSPSNGGWTLSLLSLDDFASFGPTLDSAGNLYGADFGANDIFELTPSPSGWVQQVLYTLNDQNDGYSLETGLTFDQAGNLYGSTFNSGPNGGGTVFQLSPSNGGWVFNLLYGFTNGQGFGGPADGKLLLDANGNVYGATDLDGAGNAGSLFRLTPSDGGWTYTDLYDFSIPSSSGCFPNNDMVRDADGNLYGTTQDCGSGLSGMGVVFEITP
jgi:uncharacterized repeat protein (TIGR03803 family)